MLIIRELCRSPQRFSDLAGRLGVPRDTLTGRLRRLEAAGIIARNMYQSRPMRFRYHLTAAGEELGVMLEAIATWCSRHLTEAPAFRAAREGSGPGGAPRIPQKAGP